MPTVIHKVRTGQTSFTSELQPLSVCGRWLYYYHPKFIKEQWRGVTCKVCKKRKKTAL